MTTFTTELPWVELAGRCVARLGWAAAEDRRRGTFGSAWRRQERGSANEAEAESSEVVCRTVDDVKLLAQALLGVLG
jgi:hypothetical protein